VSGRLHKKPVTKAGRRRGAVRRTSPTGRFAFMLVIMALLLVAVAVRLTCIQVLDGPALAKAAEAQRTRDITLTARRGSIFDREGEPLAVTTDAKTVYAVPMSVKDPSGVAKQLARVLGGTEAAYRKKLAGDSSFVYIARKVEVSKAEELEKLDLAGIAFVDDSRRVYPSNALASQVLGFVGIDDNGLAGLEKYYDQTLSGENGRLVVQRGRTGTPIPGGVTYEEQPVDGQDVTLTIDKDIQYQCDVELAKAVKQWGAKSGSVVVMNPNNGEILAMSSYPTFDPNKFSEADPDSFRNQPIVDAYEPGSTLKSITAASVMEAGLFTPDSMFDLPPTLTIGGRTIHESHDRPEVHWSLTDIVTESSNVGAVKLGLALGEDGLYKYFSDFGLTEKTGVDFPGEAQGYLPSPALWSASSIANIPFGQGISVTGLQLARALSAIANGGELVTPHFLKSVSGSSETTTWPTTRSISTKTASMTRSVLRNVVVKGTGVSANIPGYDVAGKTGTAQVPRTDGKAGYKSGAYIASFSGFFPAGDPQILILVRIDEPSLGYYAASVAAPTFKSIATFCIGHLKMAPTKSSTSTTSAVTDGSQDSGQ